MQLHVCNGDEGSHGPEFPNIENAANSLDTDQPCSWSRAGAQTFKLFEMKGGIMIT